MVFDDESYCVRQGEGHAQLVISYHHDGTDRFGKIMRREDEKSARWSATVVAEQPAATSGLDTCRLVVGLSDTESLDIKVDTCQRATRVGEAIVRKL